MAKTTTTNPQLQIQICATGVSYTGEFGDGVIVFNETTRQIGVNGTWYAVDYNDYEELKSTVSSLETLVGTTGVSEQISTAITNAFETVVGSTGAISTDDIGNITLDGGKSSGTVKEFLAAIQSEYEALNSTYATDTELSNAIATVNSTISTLQSTVDGKVASVTAGTGEELIGVTGSTGVVISSTTKLTNAVSSAESAVQSVELTGASGNLFTVSSGTAVSGSIDGSKILVGGSTGAYYAETIYKAINELETTVSTLSGDSSQNIASIMESITILQEELQAEGVTGTDLSNTLLDTLRLLQLRTSGSEYKGVDSNGTVGSTGSPYALQTSLENLVSLISSTATSTLNSAKDYTDQKIATAATGLLGTSGTTGATIYGAKLDAANALAAAQAAQTAADAAQTAADKHTTITEATGTVSTYDYISVVGATAESGGLNYTIKTTTALDNAIASVISWTVNS